MSEETCIGYGWLWLEGMEKHTRRLIIGGLVGIFLGVLTAGQHDARAQTTPGTATTNPAASASPAAAATPVPPLSSPTLVGPLTMASPNEINTPKYVPFLSELPAPVASLLDFDVNGVVSALGYVQNNPQPGDYDYRGDFSNATADHPEGRRHHPILCTGGRLQHSRARHALYPTASSGECAIRGSAGRLFENRSDRQLLNYGRQSTDAVSALSTLSLSKT